MYFAVTDFHRYHSKNQNLNMAQCDSYQNWYHRNSENIAHVFNGKPSNL